MPFKRAAAAPAPLDSDALTAAMVGIGMNFAASAARDPNIEDTLLHASVEGMDKGDLRVLAVLVTWFGIHAPWVNADRLTKLVSGSRSARVRAFWSALARWQGKDRRFARLAKIMIGPSYRADMWAELENEPDLSASELARRAYGSFATAWHVRRDFGFLAGGKGSGRRGPRAARGPERPL
jgi:hypothetical protein